MASLSSQTSWRSSPEYRSSFCVPREGSGEQGQQRDAAPHEVGLEPMRLRFRIDGEEVEHTSRVRAYGAAGVEVDPHVRRDEAELLDESVLVLPVPVDAAQPGLYRRRQERDLDDRRDAKPFDAGEVGAFRHPERGHRMRQALPTVPGSPEARARR